MKYNILSVISAAVLLFGVTACHSPEEFEPNVDRAAIDNITAKFLDDDSDENLFNAEIDHEKGIITIVFPYNYPRESDKVLNMSRLIKVRVQADLDNNAYVEPPLMYMDLTKENFIKVTDQVGNVKEYKVIGEIRKSTECAITEFKLPAQGLDGIINDNAKTVSLLTFDDITGALAEIKLSHGATISPDPTTVPTDYIDPVEFTVTAQNRTDKAVYIVKRDTPNKLSSGMRKGSEKLIWTKKLGDLGYSVSRNTAVVGLGTADQYLVLNESANSKAVYIDVKTGEKAGEIDLSSIAGDATFYMTSDNANNLLFCNNAAAGGKFTIYRIKGLNGTPTKYIEFDAPAGMGRKISVAGDLDKDAIITAPHEYSGSFSRWEVKGGVVSAPETVTIVEGVIAAPANWGINADVVYSNPSNIQSDYYVAYYTEPRYHIQVDGKTNAVKNHDISVETEGEYTSNWVMNAVDYIEFNKGKFMLTHSVNSFTWGTDDRISFFDATAGNLDTRAVDCTADGLNVDGNYGANAAGAGADGTGTGDVKLYVSEDGFYLYAFFSFTNGYVGCIRVDCIDM